VINNASRGWIWLAAATYQNYRSNDIIKELDDQAIDKEKLEKRDTDESRQPYDQYDIPFVFDLVDQ
jgi:hypothetical protein